MKTEILTPCSVRQMDMSPGRNCVKNLVSHGRQSGKQLIS